MMRESPTLQGALRSANFTTRPQLIFLVEEETGTGRALQSQLQHAGFAVRWLSASEMLRAMQESRPALLVIDITQDGGSSGLDLCQRVRQHGTRSRTPIICLTGSADQEERIAGLEAGADDCLARTVSSGELIARVQAVLRRFSRSALRSSLVRFPSVMKLGELEIDRPAMRIWLRGKEVTITTLEFRLMEHLAQHLGKVFTRDELLDAVWGDTQFVTPRTVDACIRRIREKIETDATSPCYLKTVRGAGYRLDLNSEATSEDTVGSHQSGAA